MSPKINALTQIFFIFSTVFDKTEQCIARGERHKAEDLRKYRNKYTGFGKAEPSIECGQLKHQKDQ